MLDTVWSSRFGASRCALQRVVRVAQKTAWHTVCSVARGYAEVCSVISSCISINRKNKDRKGLRHLAATNPSLNRSHLLSRRGHRRDAATAF